MSVARIRGLTVVRLVIVTAIETERSVHLFPHTLAHVRLRPLHRTLGVLPYLERPAVTLKQRRKEIEAEIAEWVTETSSKEAG